MVTPTGDASSCNAYFLSTSSSCEGFAPSLELVGYMSPRRGGETLRALRRCRVDGHPGLSKHAIDLACDSADAGVLLGFVR